MIVEESLDPFNSKIFKGEKTFVRVDVVGDTSKCVTIFEAKEKCIVIPAILLPLIISDTKSRVGIV